MLIDFLNSYFKSSLWGIKISSCIMEVSSQTSLLQTFVSYLLYICLCFFRFRASLVVIGEISQLIMFPVIRPTCLNYILANSPHWTRYKCSRVWVLYRSDETYVQDTLRWYLLNTVPKSGPRFGKYFHKYGVHAILKFYRKQKTHTNLT
jgi:hypothetical protein